MDDLLVLDPTRCTIRCLPFNSGWRRTYLRSSCPCTEIRFIHPEESRAMASPKSVGSYEWIESWIYIGFHLNHPNYPLEEVSSSGLNRRKGEKKKKKCPSEISSNQHLVSEMFSCQYNMRLVFIISWNHFFKQTKILWTVTHTLTWTYLVSTQDFHLKEADLDRKLDFVGKSRIFIWVLGTDPELSCGFWMQTQNSNAEFLEADPSPMGRLPHTHICGYAHDKLQTGQDWSIQDQ